MARRHEGAAPDVSPPHDEQAEMAVLGSLMLSAETGDYYTTEAVVSSLEPEDFYFTKHGMIYRAVLDLAATNRSPDIVLLGTQLQANGQLQDIGGPAYLALLVESTPTAAHAQDWCDVIKAHARRRHLLSLSGKLAQDTYAGRVEVDTLLVDYMARLDALRSRQNGYRSATFRADDLLRRQFSEPTWVVPQLLTAGLAFLAGRPKVGKSWLLMQLAGAVASGGKFLGRQVPQGSVIYYALEDSPRRLQSRMVKQMWKDGWDITFRLEAKSGMSEILRAVEVDKPSLLLVDTFSRLLQVGADSNSVEEMTALLGPLQQRCLDIETACMMADHHKKSLSGGDWLDDLMGSTGKTAVPDTLWGLYRERGKEGATLRVLGRDLPEEHELALSFGADLGLWQLLGNAEDVRMAATQKRLLSALQELGGRATTTELADHLEISKGNASRSLADLVANGSVKRAGRQGNTVPYELVHRPEPLGGHNGR